MKRLFLSVLFVLLLLDGLEAQRRNGLIGRRNTSEEYIIFSLGPDYCFADTKGSPFNESPLNNMDVSLGFRQRFSGDFGPGILGYKAALNYSNFTGTDGSYVQRGYSFKTNVLQLAVQGEYTYQFGKRYSRSTPNAIYGFIGAGVLRSNASLAGLNPNNYPKNNYRYKPTYIAPVIPYGFGYQYDLQNGFYIGAEFCWRYTLSDYIDGFKPPYPDSKSNDVMDGFSITVGYRIL
ncbi:MAG: hypothetical protein Q8904_01905 [Bacteroidota bacterium]|nr:hypothetical protein [Bacteroidota bacterium]